ncbi:hypothetical protein AX15_003699 [Amanita polypyramis BW_CC]|nr:hypothetical protein AX15_003699 [Amanita polypyramis BW_CC]
MDGNYRPFYLLLLTLPGVQCFICTLVRHSNRSSSGRKRAVAFRTSKERFTVIPRMAFESFKNKLKHIRNDTKHIIVTNGSFINGGGASTVAFGLTKT